MQLGLAAALEAVRHSVDRTPAGRGQIVGDAHRHAVAAAPRQWHAHQHIAGAAFGLVRGAQHVVVRQRPVHFDIAQHVLLVEGAAFEAQAQALAHQAVRAVGTDQIAAAQAAVAGIAAQRGRHAVGVLLEGSQAQPAFGDHATHGQFLGQHALGLVLRDGDEAEGRLGGQGQFERRRHPAVDADDLAAQRHRRAVCANASQRFQEGDEIARFLIAEPNAEPVVVEAHDFVQIPRRPAVEIGRARCRSAQRRPLERPMSCQRPVTSARPGSVVCTVAPVDLLRSV